MTIQGTLERVRAEFVEMPGLRLTATQVERLCGIDPPVCRAALDALVDVRFLRVDANGRYARVFDGRASCGRESHGAHQTHPLSV